MTHALPRISISPATAGYLVLGVVAAGAALWLLNGGAKTVAGAVGALPGNVVGGLAEGIGDSLGIPRTSQSECDAALREGRLWRASVYCPAGTFIKGLFGGGEAPAPITRQGESSGVDQYAFGL